jgi:GTP-binding protein EngB required for normal cell division
LNQKASNDQCGRYVEGIGCQGVKMKIDEVIKWYETHAKPFLEKHAPDRLPSLEADYLRLKRLKAKPDEVTICFLGNSGVGKSTLLNALAAGENHVLPAGGIGPLTAQATEVRFSEERRFRVTYHPKGHLWKLTFALEARLNMEKRAAKMLDDAGPIEGLEPTSDDLIDELSNSDIEESAERAQILSSTDSDSPKQDGLEGYIKQAKNIVCGNQFIDRALPYLVDGLRLACGKEPRWGSDIDAGDLVRIRRVQEILKAPKGERTYERREGSDLRGFQQDMVDHAAGYLSPLIERIEVGWPSDLLEAGIVLVDLPGVGIAQDAYREVTSSYVRDKARAVIVTVDRAGPTESTVDLLRTSGYWERLVGASDDPTSDACGMLIAVTKVDNDTQSEWEKRVAGVDPGMPKPKKREIFAQLVEAMKPRMKAQIIEQLGRIGVSSNSAVNTAREQARASILESLEIHPVSAQEFKKLLRDDEDDRAFLIDLEQTGVPQLQRSLKALAETERISRDELVRQMADRLATASRGEIQLIESSWQQETRAEEEAQRLEAALKPVLDEKKEEYRARAAGFREFLKEAVPEKINTLVLEAREVAQEDVRNYLNTLRGYHWATLRAAVRRGGIFDGSRTINLPDDITGYFQEPMAAVWGQKLLRDIRRRTGELSDDIVQIVKELCDWANTNAGAVVNKKLLDTQQERIALLADQMKTVGKEAVDELRDTVKKELSKTIRGPIKTACEKFVRDGNDYGPGVKYRILELFNSLAETSTRAAKAPAIKILTENAASVRADIQKELKKGGDPIQDTVDLIVEKHEDRVRRSDAQRRRGVLQEAQTVIAKFPDASQVSTVV